MPVFGAMLLGPALAGLGHIALLDGRAGLRDIWERQRRWRVGFQWYAIALLTTPILLLVILGTLSLTSAAFIPSILATDDILGVLAFGIIVGLFAGFLEEIGWTGFALPRLRDHHSLLVAGLLLGLIWGVWHGLSDYWATSLEFGDRWLLRIGLWTAALTAYRILIVWVYDNTQSLLVAQLMHASFSGSQGILVPTLSVGEHFLWYSIFTVVLWTLVAGLAVSRRNRRQRGASLLRGHTNQ